ncbi:MAG TPA: cation transporter [Candidatus Limnocylindrales bacterium]
MMPAPRALGRALALSAVSVAWGALVGSIAVVLAVATGSLSLLGFGMDSAIDAGASVVLMWRFLIERRHPHRAERVERVAEGAVGLALAALAVYLLAGASSALLAGDQPERSDAATVLLIASVVFLPGLSIAKWRVARRLSSRALRADSLLTGVAGLLAGIGLVSTLVTAWFGLWWADAVAAIVVAALVAPEAVGAIRSARSPAE